MFVVALLLFGPEQLPGLARQAGKIAGELRKGSNALRREFYNTVYPPDVTNELRHGARSLSALRAEILAPPVGAAPVSRQPESQTPTSEAPESSAQPTLESIDK